MHALVSFAALFLSIALLQLSSGGLAPLDALSGVALGFSRGEIGLLGSAHFLGFFAGCWWAPRLMGSVGHTRAFATFTAMGTIGLLGHVLTDAALAWAGLRVLTGLCIAGAYTVIEAWLQAKTDNANRGRMTGAYRLVDMGAALGAQMLIVVLPPAAYTSYTLLALVSIAALLPLTLSTRTPPSVPRAPRLRPRLAGQRSQLAVAAVLVAAVSGASFRMVGPVYGSEVGLAPEQIAAFLAAWVLGGALAQYPVGWLADRFDRRHVLIGLSVAAIIACGTTVGMGTASTAVIFANAMVFGMTSFPIYSVAASHAHDFASDDERVELSASLMFLFALGAIGAPLLATSLIDAFGPAAMFGLIAVAHAGLIGFGLVRMRLGPTAIDKRPYVWTPRTSFTIGRLIKRGPDRTDR